jgi:hypothetical protein
MKKLLLTGLALCLCSLGLVAQQYKSRKPTATELDKIAGLSIYPEDGPHFHFTMYYPGEAETYVLNPTNNVLVFKSNGALTNVSVYVPNPTNTARKAFLLNADGNVKIELLTVAGDTTFTTSTNVVALTSWISATNCSFWLFNNNRTAWHIMPVH